MIARDLSFHPTNERIEIAKRSASVYPSSMFRRITAVFLGAAYLGLALSWASPVVFCSATLERCPGGMEENCEAQGAPDCCSHGESESSSPACCVTLSEKGHDGALPSMVKIPGMPESEWLVVSIPSPLESARSVDSPTSANAPDPPGPAGRSLLIQVSRQLV